MYRYCRTSILGKVGTGISFDGLFFFVRQALHSKCDCRGSQGPAFSRRCCCHLWFSSGIYWWRQTRRECEHLALCSPQMRPFLVWVCTLKLQNSWSFCKKLVSAFPIDLKFLIKGLVCLVLVPTVCIVDFVKFMLAEILKILYERAQL